METSKVYQRQEPISRNKTENNLEFPEIYDRERVSGRERERCTIRSSSILPKMTLTFIYIPMGNSNVFPCEAQKAHSEMCLVGCLSGQKSLPCRPDDLSPTPEHGKKKSLDTYVVVHPCRHVHTHAHTPQP